MILATIFLSVRDNPDSVLTVELNAENFLTISVLAVILLLIQILLNWFSAYNTILREEKVQFYPKISPENKYKKGKWGKYSPEEIRELLEKTAKKGNFSIKSAYLETSIVPKINSYNFTGRQIYLNSNLLQICSPSEVEAAIAVEIGYTSRFSSFITYLNYNFKSFLALLYVIPFFFVLRAILLTWFNSGAYLFEINRVILQLFFLLGLTLVSMILWKIQHWFIKYANRYVQFIAIADATHLIGKKTMINMLVKQGQRTEALDILLEELKWLESLEKGKIYSFDEKRLLEILPLFPPEELSEEVAREISATIFLKSRLKNLANYYYFEIADSEKKIEESANILRQKRILFLEDEQKKRKNAGRSAIKDLSEETIDWRQADIDGNLDLDEKEIEILIQSLRSAKKFLFENEVAKNALFKRRLPIHKQILFVHNL